MLLCKFNFDCLCIRGRFHCSCQVIWHQLKIYIIGFIFPFNAILIKEIALKEEDKKSSFFSNKTRILQDYTLSSDLGGGGGGGVGGSGWKR